MLAEQQLFGARRYGELAESLFLALPLSSGNMFNSLCIL